jgi:hypothetical protein
MTHLLNGLLSRSSSLLLSFTQPISTSLTGLDVTAALSYFFDQIFFTTLFPKPADSSVYGFIFLDSHYRQLDITSYSLVK